MFGKGGTEGRFEKHLNLGTDRTSANRPGTLRDEEFLTFLRKMDREIPRGMDLHLIVDNYGTHKHPNFLSSPLHPDQQFLVEPCRTMIRRHRKTRLSPIQSLYLGLLVYAKHKSLVRRVEIKPNHIGQLLYQLLILRKLECLDPMGLKAMRIPDPGHVEGLTPWALAIVLTDQCVAPAGLVCSVASTIS